MRKLILLILAAAVLLSLASFASAEQTTYQKGDKMEDFSATLSDGTQTSLYGLLQEKKAVLINFWASWCSPCKMEFPAMQQAYDEMSDDIGIVALSCEPTDTDEIVLALKDELGLSSLPMGLDNGLAARFALEGYPTSVLVDKNGVICFMEARSIPDKNKFKRLFNIYTADDYSQSVLIDEIPTAAYVAEYPTDEAVAEAMGVAGEDIAVSVSRDGSVWPFLPSEDGSFIEASNGSDKGTKAVLTVKVDVEEGSALGYDYSVSCQILNDPFTVAVDGEIEKFYGGYMDWTSDYVVFKTAGEHTVEFAFERSEFSPVENAFATLRSFSVIPAPQTAEMESKKPAAPKTLSGNACEIAPVGGNFKKITFKETKDETSESSDMSGEIILDDSITLRIKIGTDIDENFAFVADSENGAMLSTLPRDDEGYLYTADIISMADGNAYPYNSFSVYSSAIDIANANTNNYQCFASEADADEFVNMVVGMATSYGMTGYSMSWEYEDGSPKLAGETVAEKAVDDGTGEYVIKVSDEDGKGVAGVMIQICDEGTCQVAVTDDSGAVTHNGPRYPYEIHVLKAPEGYAPDANNYIFPEEGGEMSIVLKKL